MLYDYKNEQYEDLSSLRKIIVGESRTNYIRQTVFYYCVRAEMDGCRVCELYSKNDCFW